MDLPVELRLSIAEYALTADGLLRWTWLSQSEDGKLSGTFDGLEELTSLSRVSRQLRAETLTLVWKINTLIFEDPRYHLYPDEDITSPFENGLAAISKAVDLVVCHEQQDCANNVREAIFKLAASDEFDFVDYSTVSSLAELAEYFHNARIEIRDDVWDIYITNTLKTSRRQREIDRFMSRGHNIQTMLSTCGLDSPWRSWRIMPNLRGDGEERLRRHLSTPELERVLDWITNGL